MGGIIGTPIMSPTVASMNKLSVLARISNACSAISIPTIPYKNSRNALQRLDLLDWEETGWPDMYEYIILTWRFLGGSNLSRGKQWNPKRS